VREIANLRKADKSILFQIVLGFDLFKNNVVSNYFGANILSEEINYLFSQ
jgi:hypothetical protein